MNRAFLWTTFAACAALLLTAGSRAEDLKGAPEATEPDKDGFYRLFNGKNLDGWKVGKNPDTFKVEDGTIIVNGVGPSHLFYDGPVSNHVFKNFHLKLELKTFPKANSGVYFHTKYQEEGWPNQGFEAQVNATHPDPRKSGSLYAVQDCKEPGHEDEKWFTYEIMVEGKKITMKIDGKTVNEFTVKEDYQPPKGMAGRVLGSGTFALQGHDPVSKVVYRSVMVRPLPE
jgi:hypothetical protein